MEIHERKAVSDELKKYDHLAKDSDFIEVTEWANGEGWDICLNDKLISLRLWIIIGNKLIMKIEYTDGCICTSLTVDGKETAYMTPEEIKVSIRAMLDRETDIATLQDVWMSLIEHLGEYKDLGHCECCGDWISNYTLEI